jgi:hypothetical protein
VLDGANTIDDLHALYTIGLYGPTDRYWWYPDHKAGVLLYALFP